MLRSAVDLRRRNKPRLPSQKTTTDAKNFPCRSQKHFHCRKKPSQHCREKPPTPTVAKKTLTNPRSAVDLRRCNKPRLPSQKTTTDAKNPPCRSQKPFHCRKKPPQHCRKKPPTPTVAKKPLTNPL